MASPRPLAERFWKKVQKTDGCWLWSASCRRGGYGQFFIRREGRRNIIAGAPAISWALHHGRPVPDGMDVCHTCDNPRCVRPEHLFIGTRRDNMRDASSKGRLPHGAEHPLNRRPDLAHRRFRPGSDNPMSKLSAEQVAAMRSRYAAGGVTFRDLSREFGVCYQHAHLVVRGRRWSLARAA